MRNYPLTPFTAREVAKKLTDDRLAYWLENAQSEEIRTAVRAEIEARKREDLNFERRAWGLAED